MVLFAAAICLPLHSAFAAPADVSPPSAPGAAASSTIEGAAYDLATGDTLSGIDVSLWRASDEDSTIATGSAIETATTGQDGRYMLPAQSPGDYVVKFIDPTGVRTAQVLDGDADAVTVDPPDDASDGAGVSVGELDGYLGAPWTLAPQVVDGVTGDPLPGITVQVAPFGTTDYLPQSVTATDGTFSVGPFAVPATYWVYLSDPSGGRPSQYACDEFSAVTVFDYPAFSGSTISTPEIVMHEPGSMDGQITSGDDGSAIANAPVQVWHQEGVADWQIVATTTADADGRYALSALPPGHYCVSARDPQGVLPDGWSNHDSGPSSDGDSFVADVATTTIDIVLGDDSSETPGSGSTGEKAMTTGAALRTGFTPIRPFAPASVRRRTTVRLRGTFVATGTRHGWFRVECSRLVNGHWRVQKAFAAKSVRRGRSLLYSASFHPQVAGRWRIRIRWTPTRGNRVWSKYRAVRVTR